MPERVRELRRRLYSGQEEEILEWINGHGDEVFDMMSDFEGYGVVTFLSGRGYDVSHLEKYLLKAAMNRKENHFSKKIY